MSELKEKLHKKCLELVEERIATNEAAMKAAQESANKEQRSTAGDKYDTARAMSQNERDIYARQLAEAVQMKKVLLAIDPSRQYEIVESGAIVKAESGNYYLSVSCGKIDIDGVAYFAISPLTPIGQAILDKKVGKSFEVNGRMFEIKSIT